MEWAVRIGPNTLSVVPETSLFHQRLGCKVAVDLSPAATAAGASTVAAWSSLSDSEETGDGAATLEAGGGREAGLPREFTAGKMMEFVVQARDVYGNLRGVGECLVDQKQTNVTHPHKHSCYTQGNRP